MASRQRVVTLSKADIADMILSYSVEALESFLALTNSEVRMMVKKMQRLSEKELLKIASLRSEHELSFDQLYEKQLEMDELMEREELLQYHNFKRLGKCQVFFLFSKKIQKKYCM